MKNVAVLLSTYNGRKYINQQIDSILNQECEDNIRIIVRDDGSTDGTIKILEKYELSGKIELIKGINVGAAMSFYYC